MPLEMFLKLTGIQGESTDAKHKGEIDVLAWSWGLLEQAPSSGAGAGAVPSGAKTENLSIQKTVDLASPVLLAYSAQHKNISDGTLTTRKAGGSDFLLLKMTDVAVLSVQMSASTTENRPIESVTLSFSKWQFDYQPVKADGTVSGPGQSFGWDITTAKQA